MRKKQSDEISDALIGGNPSENPEEQDEDGGGASGGGDTGATEVDVVADYRLVETGYNKKDYQTHLKVVII